MLLLLRFVAFQLSDAHYIALGLIRCMLEYRQCSAVKVGNPTHHHRHPHLQHDILPSPIPQDVTYGRNGNQLDMHVPKGGASKVMIFIYGGAWATGSKAYYSLLAKIFVSRGWAVVVPHYTLYPKGTVVDMVADVLDTIVWTREHAAEHNFPKVCERN